MKETPSLEEVGEPESVSSYSPRGLRVLCEAMGGIPPSQHSIFQSGAFYLFSWKRSRMLALDVPARM